jgi:spermidine synthase
MDERSRLRSVAPLVLGSGLCALVYQVSWARELRLVFGATTPASSTVLAVFMGGLGLGSLLLGRRAERAVSPLAFYGRLEIGVGLAAAASPWLLMLARRLYLATGGSEALGWLGSTLVRLVLAAVVLGLPTFLMGGTLPAVARAVTPADDGGRRVLGWLYGCNTVGAVAGAELTTFLLLESLGQRRTLWIAALLNLLVGMRALSLARAVDAEPPRDATAPGEEAASEVEPASRPAPVALLLVAAALVGCVFFLMEMVWYRLLTPLLGGTTYTLGTILVVALAGIGVGGLLYGRTGSRRLPSLAGLAATCALEGLFLIAPLALAERMAVIAQSLRSFAAFGFGGLVLGWILVTGIAAFPASLVAGYQFPLLVALLGRGRRQIARETGLLAACNTGGAIVGALAGGFGIFPLIGAPGAWRLATAILLALSLVVVAADWRRSTRRSAAAVPLIVAAAAGALSLAPGPGALWRHGGVGYGRAQLQNLSPNQLRAAVLLHEGGLAWEEDGRESAVALRDTAGYAFFVNGKPDGAARGDASTQVMAPLVGALLHGAPRRGLVVGLGTGSSAGWLATVPGMERVDVVELEPAIVRVARDCAAVNRRVLDNPRVHLHIGDGREYLLTRDERWDVIMSEPSNPYLAGVANLFTTEFYRAVAARLSSRGVFVQWLQAYSIDAGVVASIYTSLGAAFPQVETWTSNDHDLLLVASKQPLRHDLARERELVGASPYREALDHTWGVGGIEGFYAGFLAGPSFARRMAAAGAPANVDDRPVIEFALARDLGQTPFSIADLRAAATQEERRIAGTLDWNRVAQLTAVRSMMVVGSAGGGDLRSAPESAASPAGESGDPLASLVGTLNAAEQLADAGDEHASILADALAPEHPIEAHAVRARWHLRNGRRDEAIAELEQAFVAYRTDPWPWPAFMRRALALASEAGREPAAARALLPALEQPFAVHLLDGTRRVTALELAQRTGDASCVAILHSLEPYPIWEEPILRQRAACYARAGDPLAARAADDLAMFLGVQPPSVRDVLPSPGSGR